MIKKRSKNEAKRQQILDSATVLFTEQGYAATSMDLIANNADVSKQTVYSHFGSKDELFSASIEYKCETAQILDLTSLDLSNLYGTLFQLAQRFVEIIISKEACAMHKICAFESNTYPQVSELFYKAGPLRVIDEVTQLMTVLDKKGLLTIENPRSASVQFLNIMKGELWMQVEFNVAERASKQEMDDYLRSSVTVFIKGYSS